jgi:hypothetical protein
MVVISLETEWDGHTSCPSPLNHAEHIAQAREPSLG